MRMMDGRLLTRGRNCPLARRRARRRFVSASGPRIKPRMMGVTGKSNLFIRMPRIPKIRTIQASNTRLLMAIAPMMDSSEGIAGNAQSKQRNHGAANAGIVSRFGSHQTTHVAFAILFRMLRGRLGYGIGNKVSGHAANAGQYANEGADNTGEEHVADLLLKLPEGEAKALDMIAGHNAFRHCLPFDHYIMV